MNIREAKIEDWKEIQRLNHLLFLKEYDEYAPTLNPADAFTELSEEYYKKSIKEKNSLTLVCEEGEKIVGYLIGKLRGELRHRKDIGMAEIDNMFVEADYRSQGLGGKMVKELESWAKDKGANRLKVGALVGNKNGFNFYKNQGFKEYEVIFEKEL